MKVGPAFSLLNHDTAAALRFLVQRGDLPQEALTPAWFIETIYRWFKVLTSRTTKLGISKLNHQKYEDSQIFLKDMTQSFLCIHAWEERGVMDVEWSRAGMTRRVLEAIGLVCTELRRFSMLQ
ncbi:hypothetical protein HPB51_002120 [Rhipicephalus microplus]|uniref:Uncharacterized protein n=1 Tax=Rhipicephalus microplus TaxID=6941 RepID=A0A9J6DEC7_RHIMP|nr:hypothetical protein HPB51_002120 [Rhipicephalus microplus]